MATWETLSRESPDAGVPKKMRSPGTICSRLTSRPSFTCWEVSRGSSMPFIWKAIQVSPLQSTPFVELPPHI